MTGTDYLTASALRTFIDRALKEDIGEGDQSAFASVPKDAKAKAKLVFKDDGLIAGMDMARRIFNRVDSTLAFTPNHNDGDQMYRGQIGFNVEGSAWSILSAERLVLNCLQRMSGIATKTRQMVDLFKEDSGRFDKFSLRFDDMLVDFSKNRITEAKADLDT